MNINRDQEEKYLLCIADVLSLFRKSKRKILCWAFVFGIIGIFLALKTPILYQAEGTFREKGMKSNNFSPSSVMQILSGGNLVAGESETASLMTSRKILKEVIEKLGLQANLQAASDIETIPKTIKHNIWLTWAAVFGTSPKPVLKDLCCPLKIQELQYSGEIPLALYIDIQEDGNFKVLDLHNSKALLGEGKIGKPFRFEKLSLVFLPIDSNQPLKAQPFVLVVNSLVNTANELCKNLKVELAKIDKGLLMLKSEHRDRYVASEILNTLMNSYQSYLKTYHKDIALNQLDYLSVRRDQLTQTLTSLMEKHADLLSTDLNSSGFIESAKEMDFLSRSQHEYKRKLLDNEMEIKRLASIKPDKLAYYDRYSPDEGDSSIINAILSEVRDLKQQRDSLEIEVQKKAIDQGTNLQVSFEQQLNELKEVQQYLVDLQKINQQYEKGNFPDSQSKLFNDPRFLLKEWVERLQNIQDHSTNWKEVSENFKFYLNNLERLFGVHERILQERLTHQQNPSGEYQGISLEVATELYLDYSKQLIQMEETIRQNLFFIRQIEDPTFEITSLSSGLTDNVSRAIIDKASQLILNLRDQNNQSIKEHERIKEELNLQRTFLTLHLKQMVQLMELNKQLIDEKIFSLQNVSLELIHQGISLLEKNLQEYLKSRLLNLQQERSLVKRQLESVHSDMALLPRKWVSEQLILQAVTTNQRIVEEIAKLVESKNISHNLEVIQSAPVDIAYPPVHPRLPKVYLWGILGFLLGGSLGSCFVFTKALSQGFQVSAENLELSGYYFSGDLVTPLTSPMTNRLQEINLNTLRRLQTFFDSPTQSNLTEVQESKRVLLLEGQGPDYAADLADLFLKRGCRVLTIDLNFTDKQANHEPTLLKYLKGEISVPPVQKGIHGDWIAAGESSTFIIEMMHSPAFQKLMEQLKVQYDWILAVSRALPCSAEAENLLSLFPYAALTLNQEKITDLNKYARYLKPDSLHKLTFIIER